MDNFNNQISTLQNQKVDDEKQKYFPKILVFKIKLQLIGYLKFMQQFRWFLT